MSGNRFSRRASHSELFVSVLLGAAVLIHGAECHAGVISHADGTVTVTIKNYMFVENGENVTQESRPADVTATAQLVRGDGPGDHGAQASPPATASSTNAGTQLLPGAGNGSQGWGMTLQVAADAMSPDDGAGAAFWLDKATITLTNNAPLINYDVNLLVLWAWHASTPGPSPDDDDAGIALALGAYDKGAGTVKTFGKEFDYPPLGGSGGDSANNLPLFVRLQHGGGSATITFEVGANAQAAELPEPATLLPCAGAFAGLLYVWYRRRRLSVDATDPLGT